jgi:hypothetical protein
VGRCHEQSAPSAAPLYRLFLKAARAAFPIHDKRPPCIGSALLSKKKSPNPDAAISIAEGKGKAPMEAMTRKLPTSWQFHRHSFYMHSRRALAKNLVSGCFNC